MVADAVTIARDLARGIFPVQLDGLGLASALKELAENTSRQTDMLASFAESGDTRATAPADDLHLYRIAQEALSNAAKHSVARIVTIVLHHGDQSLRLTVADDGQGLPPTPQGARSMGVDSMRYRARAHGGDLTIESLPGEGTIIICEIPIRPSVP
jgi:signal transduction histidine kinase